MVWCPAVTILKLSVIFKQGAPHFHFVLGFANHGACPAEDRCQQISANPSRAWEGKLRLTGQTWWTRGPRVARGLLFPHLVLSIWQPHMQWGPGGWGHVPLGGLVGTRLSYSQLGLGATKCFASGDRLELPNTMLPGKCCPTYLVVVRRVWNARILFKLLSLRCLFIS